MSTSILTDRVSKDDLVKLTIAYLKNSEESVIIWVILIGLRGKYDICIRF